MTTFTRTQTSPYSKQQMFDLVSNFELYPDFLPFCQRAEARNIADNQVEGTLYINKGPFKKSFTTRNTLIEPDKILIRLVDGPFRQLEGEWRFEEITTGHCQVTLELTFDMKAGLLNKALNGVFEVIAKTMIDSFCKKADLLYKNGQST